MMLCASCRREWIPEYPLGMEAADAERIQTMFGRDICGRSMTMFIDRTLLVARLVNMVIGMDL